MILLLSARQRALVGGMAQRVSAYRAVGNGFSLSIVPVATGRNLGLSIMSYLLASSFCGVVLRGSCAAKPLFLFRIRVSGTLGRLGCVV